METLKEGKAYLRSNFEKGVGCPCCGQFVKLYKRKLTSMTTACLIALYKLHRKYDDNKRFFHLSEIGGKSKQLTMNGVGADFSKALYWHLIERMPKDEEETNKRTSGYWRLTKTGRKFLKGKITIKEYALIFDSKFQGYSGGDVTVKDCLNNKFDYEELMSK